MYRLLRTFRLVFCMLNSCVASRSVVALAPKSELDLALICYSLQIASLPNVMNLPLLVLFASDAASVCACAKQPFAADVYACCLCLIQRSRL